MQFKALTVLSALALAVVASAASAQITTVASFNPTTSGNVSYTGTSSGAGTISSVAAPVTFRFIDASPAGFTDFASSFNLAVQTTTGQVFGGLAIVPVSSGSLSFTAPTAVTYKGFTGVNLLSAVFTGGSVTGNIGGSTATYGTSNPPFTVTFTSDFINFSTATATDLALAINAVTPLLSSGSGGVANFTGTVAGTFGADNLGGGGDENGVVPEPATWAFMVVGFGLVGASVRRRSRRPVAA